MRKKIGAFLLTMAVFAAMAGCGSSETGNLTNSKEGSSESMETVSEESIEKYNVTDAKYTTITEGFDWGPVVTKVILDMGKNIDGSTLSKDTFLVSSVREYYASNLETMKTEEELTIETAERTVTAAYISDANGDKAEESSYVTIEMEVAPDLPESSPFYYNSLMNHNVYVDTSYVIKLTNEANLKTSDGEIITMTTTDKTGYTENKNVMADQFDLTGSYTEDHITLKYVSFIPETASEEAEANPLIIWLHGVGEGGEDPTIALYGNKVINLAAEDIQSCFGETGSYLLVPQCTTMWMDYDGTAAYNFTVEGSNGTSYYTQALMGLIESYVTSHPEIDKKRIYLGGCSNGGYMTMNLITLFPDYFAAAFPICEAYSDEWLTEDKITDIADMPIWFTHAKTDGTVPVYQGNMDYATMTFQFTLDENGEAIAIDDYSNAAYARLLEAGAKNVHYTLWENVVDTSSKYFKADSTTEPYEYMGHWSWIYTLNNECIEEIDGKEVTIFEWLAKQSK
jgi:predicted peptidase